jgi:hypothetical protein
MILVHFQSERKCLKDMDQDDIMIFQCIFVFLKFNVFFNSNEIEKKGELISESNYVFCYKCKPHWQYSKI